MEYLKITFFKEALVSSFGHNVTDFVVDFRLVGPHCNCVLLSIFSKTNVNFVSKRVLNVLINKFLFHY